MARSGLFLNGGFAISTDMLVVDIAILPRRLLSTQKILMGSFTRYLVVPTELELLELILAHLTQKPMLRVGEGGCGWALQEPRANGPAMPLQHANRLPFRWGFCSATLPRERIKNVKFYNYSNYHFFAHQQSACALGTTGAHTRIKGRCGS